MFSYVLYLIWETTASVCGVCIHLFHHIHLIISTSETQTFKLHCQPKATIIPYADQDLIVLQYSGERIFFSLLFSSFSSILMELKIPLERVIWVIITGYFLFRKFCIIFSSVVYHMLYLAEVCCVFTKESIDVFSNFAIYCAW